MMWEMSFYYIIIRCFHGYWFKILPNCKILCCSVQIICCFLYKSSSVINFVFECYNNAPNILRLFDDWANFPYTTSETRLIISNKLVYMSWITIFFLSIWFFFYNHSWIAELLGKGEGISLTLHYHIHPLHRHLDISWAITAESSPLHRIIA